MLTLDGYAAMLLRARAFAAASKQPRGDFASDERLGRGGRATSIRGGKTLAHLLVHRVYTAAAAAAARRFSDEAGGWIRNVAEMCW